MTVDVRRVDLKRLACLWPLFALLALPFLFHWKLFALDATERRIFRGDFLNQHYTWKSYALSRAKAGELPLWNPHVLGGVAIHANPQVGIFYPPTYLLLPFHRGGQLEYMALEAYQLLHQVFAGVGMLLLVRSLGVGNLGAFIAALVFTFTGFFTTPGHHAIVLTASWVPWSLFAAKRALAEGGPRSVAMLALTLAMMVLAGHPQVAYYGLLLASLWAIATGGIKRTLTRFVPALVLSIAIGAVQLFPTVQLAEDSSRASMGYDYATSFRFSPYFLASVFVPRGQVRLPGQEEAAPLHIYVGIGTLLLAAIGFLLSEHKVRLFFGAAAVVALFLSFGRDSPLFDWFYAGVPGFSRFRVPYRLLGIYTFGMAALAGLGVSVLIDAGRKTRVRLRAVARTASFVLLLLATWAAYLHTRVAEPAALEPAQIERLVGGAYFAVLLGALNLTLLIVILWRPRERWAIPLIATVLIFDIGAFVKDRGERPYRSLARARERPVHRLVHAQGYRSRHVSESNLANYSMLHGTDFVGGHAALVDLHYTELLELSRTSANALAVMNAKFIARSRPPSEFPWCGARYASPLPLLDIPPEISPAELSILPSLEVSSFRLDWSPLAAGGLAEIEIDGESYDLTPERALEVRWDEPTAITSFTVSVDSSNPGIRIEDIEIDLNPLGLLADFLVLDGVEINLHALPRSYFMVPSGVPSEIQTLEHLRCWSVHQGIQVQNPSTGEGASGFFRNNAARVVTYRPELVEIETSSPRAGYVILADTHRPGWVADVDGVDTPVLRAQWSMRAVAVGDGEHSVRFRYKPPSLRSGTFVSAAALVVIAVLIALGYLLKMKEAHAPPPPDEDFVAPEKT